MLDVRVNYNIELMKKWQLFRWNVKVGEVVLVISADVPRGDWLLGHVVEVVEGDDGFCLSGESSNGDSVVISLIMKICSLEVNEGNQNIMTVCHARGE